MYLFLSSNDHSRIIVTSLHTKVKWYMDKKAGKLFTNFAFSSRLLHNRERTEPVDRRDLVQQRNACTVASRPLLFCTFCDIMLVDQVQQGIVVWGKGGWPCFLAFEWKKKALSPQTGCGERAHPLAAPWTLSKDSGAPCLPTQSLQIAVVPQWHCADLRMHMTSAVRHYGGALLFLKPARTITSRFFCQNYAWTFFFNLQSK